MSNTSKPGLTFRETMAGPFALGPTDPAEGKASGEAARTNLAMHGTITINDIERFVREPDHVGSLAGTIDFAPLGPNLTATSGVFNLFQDTDNPQLKLMVYEMAFASGSDDYFLAGRKEVRNDPGFDLWRDTTTLLCTLHRGTDKTGPVVGAGVLTLSAGDLIQLVSTLRVTNADTPGEKAATMATFGRFFLGELWDTYAAHVVSGA